MKQLRAILFDLDDTLYLETEFVLSGFRAVAQWGEEMFGVPGETSYGRLKRMFVDGIRGRTFNLWLEELGLSDPKNVDLAVQCYRHHSPVIRPYPEVPELLEKLKKRYLLGIVTDGDWRIQERKIAALGISDLFSAIILTDQLGPDCWKPSPKPFLAAVEKLGVEAGAACYVGDNVNKDFLGARKAGLRTICVRHKDGIYGGLKPPTAEHSPDLTIDSFAELEKAITAF